MDDSISRLAAIEALRHDRDEIEAYMEVCLKQELSFLWAMAKEQMKRIDDDIYILENLPSAQAERNDNNDNFEKQVHSMFDHIWDCEIDHTVFHDTVGKLMGAVIQCYKELPSEQPEITFDDVMRYCRQRCLYVIPSETFHGLLGGKPMNDIKALIEELEIQYEAWGKQYSFAMIIRDIEKFAAGGDADAEREEG